MTFSINDLAQVDLIFCVRARVRLTGGLGAVDMAIAKRRKFVCDGTRQRPPAVSMSPCIIRLARKTLWPGRRLFRQDPAAPGCLDASPARDRTGVCFLIEIYPGSARPVDRAGLTARHGRAFSRSCPAGCPDGLRTGCRRIST